MGFGETLQEFGIKVSLAFDGKKIDEAQDKVKKFGSSLRGFALDIAGMTASVFESQNLFTSNARSLQNQADLLNINTKELQEYEYAAKVAADVNREDLVGSLKTLGDTMDKARAGDYDARLALEKLGGAMGNHSAIIDRLNDKNYKVTDAFHDMSGAIQNMSKNSPQAASRLTEFALGNAKLYNLLRQGPKALDALTKEADKNFVQNEAMIKQGYRMDVQMSKLWMMFRKLGYEIGFSVMKHLTPMINAFTKWFVANKKVIDSGINGFLDAMADGLKLIFETVSAVSKAMGPFVERLGGAQKVAKLLVEAFIAWKALSIAAAFIDAASSVGGLVVGIWKAVAALIAMTTAQEAATAAQAASAVAGEASLATQATAAAGAASGGVFATLGSAFGVAAAGAIGYGIGTLLNKGLDKLTGGEGLGGKIYDWLHPDMNMPVATPSGAAAYQGSGPPTVMQENHFSTSNTISVPQGTTSTEASQMISKASVDTHEQMMIKAKMDAARSKVY